MPVQKIRNASLQEVPCRSGAGSVFGQVGLVFYPIGGGRMAKSDVKA